MFLTKNPNLKLFFLFGGGRGGGWGKCMFDHFVKNPNLIFRRGGGLGGWRRGREVLMVRSDFFH